MAFVEASACHGKSARGQTVSGFGEPTQALRQRSGESDYTYAMNATYYPNGMLDGFSYGNGLTHKTSLDSTRQVPTRIRDYKAASHALDYSYGYDDELNITSLTDSVNSAYSLTDIKYDGLHRIETTTGNSEIGSSAITYDGLGNIQTYSSKGRNLSYSYTTTNKLSSVTGISGKYGTLGYDDRGNITSNGSRTFEYNLANQMVKSGSNSYLYDGHNRRVMQSDGQGESYSLYNAEGVLVYRETSAGGTNYVYLGKKLIAKDGFSRPDSGKQHYRPFGESIEGEADDVGYTGHKFDTDLDLSYMQQRYYDPIIGRFYSNDPVGFSADKPMMFNRYAYANNNPYKFVDPDGRAVKVAPNIQKDYNEAKSYISSKSSVGKAYFDKLESKNTPSVEVNRTSGGSDSQVGDPTGPDVINWNPNEGLVTSDGTQTPATGLVHEIIHVQNSQSGITDKAADDNMTIMKENVVNGQTGEGSRRDHHDGSVREVSGPTCRPTKNGESCG